jgi:hypothetical protein
MATVAGEVTLWDLLGLVRDVRDAQGQRYSLRSILAIAIGATLAGRDNLAAVARWGKGLKPEHLEEFGIERGSVPCHATYHNVFTDMDVNSLERVMGAWVVGLVGPDGLGTVAIDGKTARGSKSQGNEGAQLLTAYCRAAQGVLSELQLKPGENEISAAPRLLKKLPLKGVVVTGDAIFTQKKICREIVKGGGDYVFVVKENQEALMGDIAAAFMEPFSPSGAEALAS